MTGLYVSFLLFLDAGHPFAYVLGLPNLTALLVVNRLSVYPSHGPRARLDPEIHQVHSGHLQKILLFSHQGPRDGGIQDSKCDTPVAAID